MDAIVLLPEKFLAPTCRWEPLPSSSPALVCEGCITKDRKQCSLNNKCIILKFWRLEVEIRASVGLTGSSESLEGKCVPGPSPGF